jgi:four helix bundle protein
MNRFKNLKVWQEAIELAVDAYKITATFPKEEKFGLISQIQRASVSVSSNIAEGAGRNNKGEFNQFLGIAQGSLCEVESLFHLSSRLELLNLEEVQPTN